MSGKDDSAASGEAAEIQHDPIVCDAVKTTRIEDVLQKVYTTVEEKIIRSKIHRFPANLRRVCGASDYIVPRVVALGPYHHGRPELQAMEEVKSIAASVLWGFQIESPVEVYRDFLSVAREARGCYAEAGALAGISEEDFADMMFFDACFLIKCMVDLPVYSRAASVWVSSRLAGGKKYNETTWRAMIRSNDIIIMRDMMLLENQVPWLVLSYLIDRLNRLYGKNNDPTAEFVAHMLSYFCTTVRVRDAMARPLGVNMDMAYNPPHILGLIQYYQAGNTSPERSGFSGVEVPVSTSAAELAEIGVKLTANVAKKLTDMSIETGRLFVTLTLPALFLEDTIACWLVNMVALEQCTAGIWRNQSDTRWRDDYPVNSYLAVLAMLMNQEDDVRDLRARRIVHSAFSNQQTLDFFKGLAPHLQAGINYAQIIKHLEVYKQRRWLWIPVYKFLYNNGKTIAAALSAAAALFGILKAVFAVAGHHQ